VKAAILAVVLLMAVPSAASARVRKFAPPGNSAINQYVENVPTAGGGRPTGTIKKGGGGGGSGVLSKAIQGALAHDGANGRAAAALASATAPSPNNALTARSKAGLGAAALIGSSPLDSILRAASGSSPSGGLGPWLPVILIAIALGGGALALRRGLARRSE
jgi:hypothetical protein